MINITHLYESLKSDLKNDKILTVIGLYGSGISTVFNEIVDEKDEVFLHIDFSQLYDITELEVIEFMIKKIVTELAGKGIKIKNDKCSNCVIYLESHKHEPKECKDIFQFSKISVANL